MIKKMKTRIYYRGYICVTVLETIDNYFMFLLDNFFCENIVIL